MGQEIVYCFKCQIRLVGSDFERGKAFKIEAKVACSTCVLDLLTQFPDPEAELERLKRVAKAGGSSSSTSSSLRVQRPEAPPAPRHPSGTHRIALAEAPPKKMPIPVLIGIGIGILVLILILTIALQGGSSPRPDPSSQSRGTTEPRPAPAPVLSSVPVEPKHTLQGELAELDDQVRPLLEKGQCRGASALLEAVRDRHPAPEWIQGIDGRQAKVQAEARRRTAIYLERALAAAKRGEKDAVASLRLQVETQGTQAILDEFDRAMAGVVVTPEPEVKPPPPPSPAPPPSVLPAPTMSPVETYRTVWSRIASLAGARDLAGAERELKKAASWQQDAQAKKEADLDLGDLKLIADALGELPRLAPRLVKGQKLTLEYLGETGSLDSVEGTVAFADPNRVTLKTGGGLLDVPVAEIGGLTVGALLALRGETRPGDARAAALVSALDGRRMPELPEKYAAVPRDTPPAELEARRAFFAAEAAMNGSRSRAAAVGAYLELLEKHSATGFVARNKPYIDTRLAEARDFLFFAEDLSGAGSFTPSGNAVVESFWRSASDSAPGKPYRNFLEAEVYVQPGQTYHAWVHAGGCCQEVFAFSVQGTGLSGPSAKNPRETVTAEPGSDESIAIKPPSGFKKKHSDHTGPKEPEKWEWIALGPLKFSGPGLKKVRILTDQKGFSVGILVISASRTAAPRDTEMKELLKARPPVDLGPTGQVYREIFRGIPGASIAELLQHPKFKEDKPDLAGMVAALDSWNMGEDYGSRMRGYVHPPASGDYQFWIAADDAGELWLSLDDSPGKKVKICGIYHAVGQRQWDADPSQKSAPIPLLAGKRYYVEVLHKQGNGPEHVAVGWRLPGGQEERPIPPGRLSAYGGFPPRKSVSTPPRSLPPEAALARTPLVGGPGGVRFEAAPLPRQPLKGFRCSFGPTGALASLQPLYLGPSGTTAAAVTGMPLGPETEIVGKEGYVVGGMMARGSDRVNSLKVIFMRWTGSRLLPFDRYESEWLGSRAGGDPVLLAGDGTPVLGFFGRAGSEIDAVGLVTLEK